MDWGVLAGGKQNVSSEIKAPRNVIYLERNAMHVTAVEIMGMFSPLLHWEECPSGPAPTALTAPEVIAHLFCQVRDCFSRALHCLVSSCPRGHLGTEALGLRRPCLYALVPLLSRHSCSFWTKNHIYLISESVLIRVQLCSTITCSYMGPFPIGFHVRVTSCPGLPGTEECLRMPELGKSPMHRDEMVTPLKYKPVKGHRG